MDSGLRPTRAVRLWLTVTLILSLTARLSLAEIIKISEAGEASLTARVDGKAAIADHDYCSSTASILLLPVTVVSFSLTIR